jgi:hypothetical protein
MRRSNVALVVALVMFLAACESQPPNRAPSAGGDSTQSARLRLVAVTGNNTLAKDWPDELCGKGVKGRDIALVAGQFPFSTSRLPNQKIGIPLGEDLPSKQVTEMTISASARHHLNLRAIVNVRAIGTTITSDFCTKHVSFKPVPGETYELIFRSQEDAKGAGCTAELVRIAEPQPGLYTRIPDNSLDVESKPC